MEERLVRFDMFGQEFAFYSDAPDDDVERAVALLRREFEESGRAAMSNLPSSKMLVLGCLRIAARYVELQREFDGYRRQQGRRIDGLIEKMAAEME
jgi:hypothetical protein